MGGRESTGEQVGPVFLYKVDVWAVSHLLTCLGGAACAKHGADVRVCKSECA